MKRGKWSLEAAKVGNHLHVVLSTHGPAGKTGLSGQIAKRMGQSVPPRLFEEGLQWAREAAHHAGLAPQDVGPIVYDHRLDVYGYAGDVTTALHHALLFNLQYLATRTRTVEQELQVVQSMNGYAGHALYALSQQAQTSLAAATLQWQAIVDQAEKTSPRSAKTLKRLGASGAIAVFEQ